MSMQKIAVTVAMHQRAMHLDNAEINGFDLE
jgi:hypothetical protein